MTLIEQLCVAIDEGDDGTLPVLADALEDQGNPLAAGVRALGSARPKRLIDPKGWAEEQRIKGGMFAMGDIDEEDLPTLTAAERFAVFGYLLTTKVVHWCWVTDNGPPLEQKVTRQAAGTAFLNSDEFCQLPRPANLEMSCRTGGSSVRVAVYVTRSAALLALAEVLMR